MINIFKKRYKKIDEYKSLWRAGRVMDDGKPFFVRYNSGLTHAAGHPNYPFQIGVAIPFNNPTEDGLPTNDEMEDLNVIEDTLEPLLTKNRETVFVMALTTNGMREFVFYAKEWKPEFFEQEVNSVPSGNHTLQFMMWHDPSWESFKKFSAPFK